MNTYRQIFSRSFKGIAAFLFALPLYLALVNVFKTEDQITRFPIALPAPFTLENIINVINRPDRLLFEGLTNSFLITACTVIAVVFFSSTIGFYIARSKAWYMRVLLLLFIAGMMVAIGA